MLTVHGAGYSRSVRATSDEEEVFLLTSKTLRTTCFREGYNTYAFTVEVAGTKGDLGAGTTDTSFDEFPFSDVTTYLSLSGVTSQQYAAQFDVPCQGETYHMYQYTDTLQSPKRMLWVIAVPESYIGDITFCVEMNASFTPEDASAGIRTKDLYTCVIRGEGTSAPAETQSQDPAGSAVWKQDDNGWWVENPDGSRLTDQWYESDSKWYYLGTDGYMLADTATPDGYTVDADGVWVQ